MLPPTWRRFDDIILVCNLFATRRAFTRVAKEGPKKIEWMDSILMKDYLYLQMLASPLEMQLPSEYVMAWLSVDISICLQ